MFNYIFYSNSSFTEIQQQIIADKLKGLTYEEVSKKYNYKYKKAQSLIKRYSILNPNVKIIRKRF